ncbi:hypothetical protein SAMN04487944_11936 [Gracilibacillus ureilyticus]|uniref:Uncharacterized protein n=1 Tax=Gracilibacillus ureilyticus TaxID=531814 RepID=A0A1H9UTA6_9BACI|nr:hypothetical protein [Gracilibacillus ureilyticus]SES12571.1 hypothetical protein SAMN04487944_11936 [Gracilibacillus ureilyticus]
MKHYIKMVIFLSTIILTIGYTDDNPSFPETKYVEGFPEAKSSALSDFLVDFITYEDELVRDENNNYIYSQESRERPSSVIKYYKISEEQLMLHYAPLIASENPSQVFNKIRNSNELIEEPINNNQEYSLPTVEMKDNNQLEITNQQHTQIIDLNDEMRSYGISDDIILHFSINAIKNSQIFITLKEYDKLGDNRLWYHLFVDLQSATYTFTPFHQENQQELIQSEQLQPYYQLFPTVEDHISILGTTIVDTKSNEVSFINEDDLLSEDGKYVYLNGDIYTKNESSDLSTPENLSDGVQRIQTIENYAQ